MDRCPECRKPLSFFGVEPLSGRRWASCSCGMFVATDESGFSLYHTRQEPPKHLFRSMNDGEFERRYPKAASVYDFL